MEIDYLLTAARLLDRNWVNRRGSDLSREALWISEGQRAVELPDVKVGDKKTFFHSARLEPDLPLLGQAAEFFLLPTLTAGCYDAIWSTKTQSTSLEKCEPLLWTESLSKSLAALLGYSISIQSNPIFEMIM